MPNDAGGNQLDALLAALKDRFGTAPALPESAHENGALIDASAQLLAQASHASCRAFDDRPVSAELLKILSAIALSAPSKSDLQQRDIVIVTDAEMRAALLEIVADQSWTTPLKTLLVFCGNNRRQRIIHEMRVHSFANDHLDAFFNAAVDAGIALQAFISAAETVGLGCCPISGLRNQPERISDLLQLPEHVFPVAGLAVGWPSRELSISPRLDLESTVHVDAFDDVGIRDQIASYDQRRRQTKPFKTQRDTTRFGQLPDTHYGWSEDKARQYASPERSTFGAFVRSKGFNLD